MKVYIIGTGSLDRVTWECPMSEIIGEWFAPILLVDLGGDNIVDLTFFRDKVKYDWGSHLSSVFTSVCPLGKLKRLLVLLSH